MHQDEFIKTSNTENQNQGNKKKIIMKLLSLISNNIDINIRLNLALFIISFEYHLMSFLLMFDWGLCMSGKIIIIHWIEYNI